MGFVIPDGIERRAGLQQGHQQIEVLLSCCPDVQTSHCPGTTFCCGTEGKKGLRGGDGKRDTQLQTGPSPPVLFLCKQKQKGVEEVLLCLLSAAQIYSSAENVFHQILNSENRIVQIHFACF